MLPDIQYTEEVSGNIATRRTPTEVEAFLSAATVDERALSTVIGMHYGPKLRKVGSLLGDSARTSEGVESSAGSLRDNLIKGLSGSMLLSWSSPFVIEVGFSSMFRALQQLHGVSLEDLARLLLLNGQLWPVFSDGNLTLDVVYAPASDPAPPFDGDVDYVIMVVPQGMRGHSRYSRYHKQG